MLCERLCGDVSMVVIRIPFEVELVCHASRVQLLRRLEPGRRHAHDEDRSQQMLGTMTYDRVVDALSRAFLTFALSLSW